MKLLLTSLGLSTPAIVAALEDLLGRPLHERRMIYVPTAMHAVDDGPDWAWQTLQLVRPDRWGHVGLLELTALPGLPDRTWRAPLERADAVVLGGGNTPYLSHWLQRSGFADALEELPPDTVYVGVSAGSMVAGTDLAIDRARLDRDGVYEDLYGDAAPPGQGSDRTLGLVPFAIRPHLESPDFPDVTLNRIAAGATGPTWVLTDAGAIAVAGDDVRTTARGTAHHLP